MLAKNPTPRVDLLEQLIRQQPLIWRGLGTAATPSVATGFVGLDHLLPGRGWPIGGLIELIPSCEGIGELQLLVPALQHVSLTRGRPVVLISPPHVPYAPAWAQAGLPLQRLVWLRPGSEEEGQWAAEHVLRSGIAGAVLLWSAATANVAMRRLQLCADEGNALAFVFRGGRALRNASPAAVRLALHPATNALRIEVVKARGGHGGAVLCPLRRAA